MPAAMFATPYGLYFHASRECAVLQRTRAYGRALPMERVGHGAALDMGKRPCRRCCDGRAGPVTMRRAMRNVAVRSLMRVACAVRAQRRYQAGAKYRWRMTVREARRRRIAVCMADEHALALMERACVYCGTVPRERTNGLDRVDNDGPYSEANVTPCCWECNRMKSALSVRDFVLACVRVTRSARVAHRRRWSQHRAVVDDSDNDKGDGGEATDRAGALRGQEAVGDSDVELVCDSDDEFVCDSDSESPDRGAGARWRKPRHAGGHKRAPAQSHVERLDEEDAQRGARYCKYRHRAQRLGLAFEIGRARFDALTLSGECRYCRRRALPDRPLGVDRIDNRLGYVAHNIVSCCPRCNRMKGTLAAADFRRQCERVSRLWGARAARTPARSPYEAHALVRAVVAAASP